ncbi:MAG: glycosyltransferase family 2 protein [Saprospiraceae bacterium]|nr:glycosyltransferase family 2 protein [Saprospiraceae bacterium]
MRLNVIVPCYNPAKDGAHVIAQHFAGFQQSVDGLLSDVGLIVVNDGSNNSHAEAFFAGLVACVPQVQLISYTENKGKGFALRQGVAQSNADLHLITDADFPYTLESMRKVVEQLLEKGGVIAGNRNTAYYSNVPPFRRRLSKVFRWMLRRIIRQPIDDSQCGLKAFDTNGKKIFLETTINRFLFDLEFLMLSHQRVTITPVQVEPRKGIIFSTISWKVLAVEAGNLLWLLFRR